MKNIFDRLDLIYHTFENPIENIKIDILSSNKLGLRGINFLNILDENKKLINNEDLKELQFLIDNKIYTKKKYINYLRIKKLERILND